MNSVIKIYFICLVVFFLSCFDNTANDEGGGIMRITVQTSDQIWTYPVLSGSIYTAFVGDDTGTWLYPEVGGDGVPDDEESMSDDLIPVDGYGDRINYVYLYSQMGENSRSFPVLYRGSSETNGAEIVITGILPGSYYVVAFYDYSNGGNRENILNRYDRYSIYTDSAPEIGTVCSTPFSDNATTVDSNNDEKELSLVIEKNWVLGKPKTTSGSTGRIFLVSTDFIPTPDGVH